MPTIVETFLKDLDEEHRKDVFLNELYKTTNYQNTKVPSICATEYSCNRDRQCSFDQVKKDIRESLDLRTHLGMSSVALSMVQAIERDPDDFFPDKYDGFTLRIGNGSGSVDLVHMKRKESESIGRIGTIQYDYIRCMALKHAQQKKEKQNERIVGEFIHNILPGVVDIKSCTIM